MANEIDICNLALQNVQQKPISSLDEGTTEAIQCNLRYEQARDYVLSQCDWGFARRTDSLALLSSETPAEWAYAYQLPNEIIVPRYIVPVMRTGPAIRFEQSGMMILTDHPDAKLVYTVREKDPLRFSPMFVEALSWWIAACIVMPLNGSKTDRADAIKIFGQHLDDARRINANQDDPFHVDDVEASWIEARA